MKIIDFEYVSLEDVQEVPVNWDFDSTVDSELDDLDDVLEEHEATIAVAELLEELGYQLA